MWIIVFMKISILMSDCKSFCQLPLLIAQFPLLTAASPKIATTELERGPFLFACHQPLATLDFALKPLASRLIFPLLKSRRLPWEISFFFYSLSSVSYSLESLPGSGLGRDSGGTQTRYEIIDLGEACALHVSHTHHPCSCLNTWFPVCGAVWEIEP